MRSLLTKGSRLVVLLALLLSGCFRPAGESIQPTSDTSGVINQPLTEATATSAVPAITMLSPGDAITSEAATLAPASSTPDGATPDPLAVTLQIITPGFSLGLLTPDTPIPFPTALPLLDATQEVLGVDSASVAEGPASGEPCTYTVESGDSLYLIALQNDTTVAGLQEANPELEGEAPVLQIGQVLRLSDCVPGEVQAEPTEVPQETAPETSDTQLPEGSQIYRVQPGDTMGAIATRFRVTVRAILDANGLSNPNILSIGQQLIIPAPAS